MSAKYEAYIESEADGLDISVLAVVPDETPYRGILLVALLTAAILGGAMLFWSSTREKTYTGGLFVKEERQKEVAEAGM